MKVETQKTATEVVAEVVIIEKKNSQIINKEYTNLFLSKVAKSKDRNVSQHSRSRSRSKSNRKKRERTASPVAAAVAKPIRIHVGRLTRNITKDHIHEIFSNYGN